MTVSLVKGQRVSLEKVAPGLKKVMAGLGWDVQQRTGKDFDLDGRLLLLNSDEKLISEKHHIFYNNLKSPDGFIQHMGDNLTGAGDGDDEVINIDLENISSEITKMIFLIDIYQAELRQQNFGQVNNAFVRLVNVENNKEILRYDLTEDYSVETCVVICELYKKEGEWKMSAVGKGTTLDELMAKYK